MMNEYLDVVKNYIDTPNTHYALMINGEWGNGKTYFFRNTIEPFLERMNKKIIYISLNGLSDLQEINKQIYLETRIYQNKKIRKILENKKMKQLTQFSKVIHNTAMILNIAGNGEKKIFYEEIIEINDNIVLCFDDLERCNIEITEILGFINNFVEHDDIKIIIIGNEKEIKDISNERNKEIKFLAALKLMSSNGQVNINSDTVMTQVDTIFSKQRNYDVIKEKVVGRSILFVPDSEVFLKNIVEEYNSIETRGYFTFLTENISDLEYIFNKSSRKNIRLLKHAIVDFYGIYKILNNNFQKSEYKNKLINIFFMPSIILSLELRGGNINADSLTNTITKKINTLFSTSHVQEEYMKILTKYLKGYSLEKEFYNSHAINNYLISSTINRDELNTEAEYILESWTAISNIKSSRSSIQKLTDGFFELENNEFEDAVKDVLEKVSFGYYPLSYYSRIFYQLEMIFINELLEISMENLIESFKSGIDLAENAVNENDRFTLFHISEESKSNFLKEIDQHIVKRQKELENKELHQKVNEVLNLFKQGDVDKFIEDFYSLSYKADNQQLMQYININEFAKLILNSSNSQITDLIRMFNSIYGSSNNREYCQGDKEYLNELKDEIESKLILRKSVNKFILNKLIQAIDEIITGLNT